MIRLHRAHVLDPGEVILVDDVKTEIAEVEIVAKTTDGTELRFKPDEVLQFVDDDAQDEGDE